ncbi:MAG: SRPBCC family protein [Nannocystaceae bacterium]|nr:SRPBCC family protein [Nannocystaceae bacterium]
MATITKTFAVNNALEAVWARLADPGQIHHLFSFLASAEVKEGARVCKTLDGAELHERVFSIDHETRRIAYTITRSPFEFEAHAASWQASGGDDGGTTVTLMIDVLPDEAAQGLDSMLEQERPTIVAGLESKAG